VAKLCSKNIIGVCRFRKSLANWERWPTLRRWPTSQVLLYSNPWIFRIIFYPYARVPRQWPLEEVWA